MLHLIRSMCGRVGHSLGELHGTRSASALLCLLFLLNAPASHAHDPAERIYDRIVVVHLTPKAVVVDYTLEVNAFTAYYDAAEILPKEDVLKVTKREEIYQAFLDGNAKPIANNLLARLKGETLTFTCTRKSYRLFDDLVESNDKPSERKHAHLRCEYRFEAPWNPVKGEEQPFTFRETNYDNEKGTIRLSMVTEEAVKTTKLVQPDEALLKKPFIDLQPGDEERLRTASATFTVAGEAKSVASVPSKEEPKVTPTPHALQDLLFHSEKGFWLLLGLAALFGAAHALTPGHGKTLVAAYLVGQRGTVGHAILLGLVTTLTHTGVVLLVAAVLPLLFPNVSSTDMQKVLAFVGGLLIASLGFWLLQRRLAGKADHVHIGGGHHHHHHGSGEPLRLWGLITLGISGGIVPCGEALTLFILAVQWQRLDLALPLLLAFSAGLAGVLVLIGIGVVYARKLALVRWGESPRARRIARVLPLISAVTIIAIGMWLCYQSVHGSPS